MHIIYFHTYYIDLLWLPSQWVNGTTETLTENVAVDHFLRAFYFKLMQSKIWTTQGK